LGKQSENFGGDFFTHTVLQHVSMFSVQDPDQPGLDMYTG